MTLEDQKPKQSHWMEWLRWSQGFQESTRKWETSGGEWVGVGWHNEWHIVKSLPTKQSLLPCKWDSLDKDLFDGTHAEYEAANSLISIQQSWLAKTGEGASRRAFLQNPILICLMVSGSQKSQISCRLFMRLFSGPIDAPRLINTSLRRCDYMLELLMGPLNFKEQHKRCFDKRSWGKRHIWWASVRLWMWGPFCLFPLDFVPKLFTGQQRLKAQHLSLLHSFRFSLLGVRAIKNTRHLWQAFLT